ncbi:MAG: DUF6702 family protein [Pseudomonadota bacterium]
MPKLLRGLLLCLGLVSVAGIGASAHEQAIGFSEVNIVQPEGSDCSDGGCRIEVAHRLVIHDAESTLMAVLGARADLVGDPDAKAKFEAYVARKFVLRPDQGEEAVDLQLLGGEVERGYYWVYQEAVLNAPLTSISIEHGVLMDAIPQQANRVNIKHAGDLKTLVFRADPGPQSIRFD